MIKAIIRKELRENYKLALAGAGVFGLIIAMNFNRSSPPLMDEDFQIAASFYCGIFGALLGWLQIRRENHPDLRAFLIHRPLSRTGIFFGKVIAGLALYLVSAGLPIICTAILVRVPGQVAAPFDWGTTLPAIAIFPAGLAFYFAGMLSGQRQAHWPLTRSLALGAGLLAMGWLSREFWSTLLFVIITTIILAIAAWGGFVTSGDSRRDSVAAAVTLPIVMVPGAAFLLMLALTLFVNFIIRPGPRPQLYSMSYGILKDGTVVKNWGRMVTSLNGQLLKDPQTSNALTAEAVFLQSAPSTVAINLPESTVASWNSFRDSGRFCRLVWSSDQTQWFYSFTHGRLLGYDTHTREFVGSLGPEGFATNSLAPEERFRPGTGNDYSQSASSLADTHTVFHVNAGIRTVKPLFTLPDHDVIVATADISSNFNPQNVSFPTPDAGQIFYQARVASAWTATAVVASKFIYVINTDGQVLWTIPRPAAFSGDTTLQLFLLPVTDQCVLMLKPSATANRQSPPPLPTHVEFLNHDNSVAKTLDLPTLITPIPAPDLQQKCLHILEPLMGQSLPGADHSFQLDGSLLISALCAMIALALGLRTRLGVGALIGWVIFLLLTGVAGFFVFLCLQSWPARERCPNCRKLRVVNRDRCEHCAAAFAPADKNGIEIFEPLGTV